MLRTAALAALLLSFAGCAAPAPYVYRHIPGRTAELHGEVATAPANAPPPIHAAIAAANEIAGSPYRRGGGHNSAARADAYDCSGAASFVLCAAGILNEPMPSSTFRRFGEPGAGEWISVVARRDHVFLVIAGLRFDTGWTGAPHGPRWTTKTRPTNGSVTRHPHGL
jgi:hypothetical protein